MGREAVGGQNSLLDRRSSNWVIVGASGISGIIIKPYVTRRGPVKPIP